MPCSAKDLLRISSAPPQNKDTSEGGSANWSRTKARRARTGWCSSTSNMTSCPLSPEIATFIAANQPGASRSDLSQVAGTEVPKPHFNDLGSMRDDSRLQWYTQAWLPHKTRYPPTLFTWNLTQGPGPFKRKMNLQDFFYVKRAGGYIHPNPQAK